MLKHFTEKNLRRPDAFGPHQRIASAISDLIRTEHGGRAIALVGSWGCGKSTVVNLLKKSTAQKQAVFVFDAWAHEGDPLRRTFLEKFITFFNREDWINHKEKWETRLDELAQRVETNTTITTPTLTKKGALFAVLFFLTAVGMAILSGGPNTGDKGPWIICHFWLMSGLFLTFLTPFLALGYCAWASLGSRSSFRKELLGLCGGLLNKQEEITKTSTMKSPEPTSVEFQNWFYELADEVLRDDRRVLLVIDNLDRIDTGEALKLWSAIRAFVDFSHNGEKPSWSKNIWTLVAFDETAIERLWHSPSNGEIETDENRTSLISAFKEKTFQVRFQVPTPLLSEWSQFFKSQLKTAIPEINAREAYLITRIYEIIITQKKALTPRHIIIFINQIGSLLRIQSDDMPISHLALYVALSESGVKGPDYTTSINEFPGLVEYLEDEWKANLLALYYGTSKQRAIQLELGGPVGKAITEGSREAIQQLAAKHGPEFVLNAVEQILRIKIPEWKLSEPRMVAKALHVLSIPEVQQNEEEAFLFCLFKKTMLEIPKWPQLDKVSGSGIALLLKREKDEEAARQIIRSFADSSPFVTQIGTDELAQWVCGIAIAIDETIINYGEGIIAQEFRLLKSPSEYVALLGAAFVDNDKRFQWRNFRPGCPPEEIINQLVQEAGAQLDAARELAIERMITVDCAWPWDNFINALTNRLETNNPNNQPNYEQIGRFMRILLRLRKVSQLATSNLTRLVETTWFYHRYSVAKNDKVAYASALLVTMLFDPEANKGPSGMLNLGNLGMFNNAPVRNDYRNFATNPNQNEGLLAEIEAQALSLIGTEELLIKRDSTATSKPLYDQILKDLANRENVYELFSANVLISDYAKLNGILGPELMSRVVKVSFEKDTLEQQLLKRELNAASVEVFRAAIEVRKSSELVVKITKDLKNVTKEQWIEAIHKNSDLIGIVKLLGAGGHQLFIGHFLKDALYDVARAVMSGTASVSLTEEDCFALFSALTPDQQVSFKRNIRDMVIRSDTNIAGVIDLFRQCLCDCKILQAEADELVRVCFVRILERRSVPEYEWVRNLLKGCPEILIRCEKETKADLLERLASSGLSNLEEDCQRALDEIKKVCGIANEEPNS